MRKKIITIALICTMATSCIGLSGCMVEESSSSSTPESSYDFYANSVETLKDEMELTDEEADKVFGTLLEIGLDEEITYCFEETDDSNNVYYKVWWGPHSVDTYLKNKEVEKILDGDEQLFPATDDVLNLSSDIIWKDDDNMGIVNLELDGTHVKEAVINDYYIGIANYLDELDKNELKDYDYIEFVGNVIRDDKIECTIRGKMSIPAIKSYEDNFNSLLIEENIYDLSIPKALQ